MAPQALQRNDSGEQDDLRLLTVEDLMFPFASNQATAVEMSVDGCPVRLLDVSPIGARLEHDRRFRADARALRITGRGTTTSIVVRAIRSEVIDRRASNLVYVTFVRFADPSQRADEIIAALMRPADDDVFDVETFDDRLDLPYVRYQFRDAQWQMSYEAVPDQPADGFTLLRADTEAEVLCRIFECADGTTRDALRSAIEAKLCECTGFVLA